MCIQLKHVVLQIHIKGLRIMNQCKILVRMCGSAAFSRVRAHECSSNEQQLFLLSVNIHWCLLCWMQHITIGLTMQSKKRTYEIFSVADTGNCSIYHFIHLQHRLNLPGIGLVHIIQITYIQGCRPKIMGDSQLVWSFISWTCFNEEGDLSNRCVWTDVVQCSHFDAIS